MNGMSLVMSKPCCPMYKLGTSNKMDLIPRRLSNLHLQGISPPVATTRMLKHHRAFSLSAVKDTKGGSRSEVPAVPKVGGNDGAAYALIGVPVLLGVGTIGIVLANYVAKPILRVIGEILKLCAPYYKTLFIVAIAEAICVAGRGLGDVLYGIAVVLHGKPFSVGDMIEVGSVTGQVIDMGLINTSLLSAENVPILVRNSLFGSKAIVNKSRVRSVAMVIKSFVQLDEIEKIHKISEEIINMMKSDSNVYLEQGQPYSCLSGFQKNCVELTLGCNLKKMCEDELYLVKQDVLRKSAQIINKHTRAHTLNEHMGEVKRL